MNTGRTAIAGFRANISKIWLAYLGMFTDLCADA